MGRSIATSSTRSTVGMSRRVRKMRRGKLDLVRAMSGDDLQVFVNGEVFPYLKEFKSIVADVKSVKCKAALEIVKSIKENGKEIDAIMNAIEAIQHEKEIG